MPRLPITILLGISLSLAVSARPPQRVYHDDLRTCSDTVVIFKDGDTPLLAKAVEIRASSTGKTIRGASSDKSYGVVWGADSTGCYRAVLHTFSGNDELLDSPYATLSIYRQNVDGTVTKIEEIRLTDGFDLAQGCNSLSCEIDCISGHVVIAGGSNTQRTLYETVSRPTGGYGIIMNSNPIVDMVVTDQWIDPAAALQTQWSQPNATDDLVNSLLSTELNDPIGLWKYLDRDNNPNLARLGGEYTLAIVRSEDNSESYDIIYISGATTNASQWTPGMLKGRLHPTGFTGHFDLEWYDAAMDPIAKECSASIEQSGLIRLDFPLLKTSLRLARSLGRK
ncbi:MAG: hypothetical protein NC111_05655 [Bacteroides sp.]|nr:hypothetical protein [Bacteroides sp.]MCM1413319.1 hypothetical protein [Bacteroides sp.]MCM1471995.1 hypothetical protein [Bacteroides sp.]